MKEEIIINLFTLAYLRSASEIQPNHYSVWLPGAIRKTIFGQLIYASDSNTLLANRATTSALRQHSMSDA